MDMRVCVYPGLGTTEEVPSSRLYPPQPLTNPAQTRVE